MSQKAIWPATTTDKRGSAIRRPCKRCGHKLALVQDRNNPERLRVLDLEVAGYHLVTFEDGHEEAVRSRTFHIDHHAICGTEKKTEKGRL